MTNKLTAVAAITRIEDILPAAQIRLSYHDILPADAAKVVRAFPRGTKIEARYSAGENITIDVNENAKIILFLKGTYRTTIPAHDTPVANKILRDAKVKI